MVIISFSFKATLSSTDFMCSSVIDWTFFSCIFSSSSLISLFFNNFLSSSFASLRMFLIETLHFSPIDFINFLSSDLLSSFNSGIGNLINCPSICGSIPNQIFVSLHQLVEHCLNPIFLSLSFLVLELLYFLFG